MSLSVVQTEGHAFYARELIRRGLKEKYLPLESERISSLSFLFGIISICKQPHLLDDDLIADTISLLNQSEIGYSDGSGFISCPTHLPDSPFIRPHITTTQCVLQILVHSGIPLSSLNVENEAILRFVGSLQNEDGSFNDAERPNAPPDIRNTYSAVIICRLLHDYSHINIDKAVDFTLRCLSPAGAFGLQPGLEAHAGGTFCALALLTLLIPVTGKDLSTMLTARYFTRTLRWLSQRQTAGFAGRPNKEPCGCYALWVLGSLQLMGHAGAVDLPLFRRYVLAQQLQVPEEGVQQLMGVDDHVMTAAKSQLPRLRGTPFAAMKGAKSLLWLCANQPIGGEGLQEEGMSLIAGLMNGTKSSKPDPLHTYTPLFGLAMLGEPRLALVDVSCIAGVEALKAWDRAFIDNPE